MSINHKLLLLSLISCLSLQAVGQTTPTASQVRGKAIFEQYCLACHQADGSGVPMLNPPLIKSAFVAGDKTRLIGIVLKGLKDTEVNGEMYDNPMPPFDYLTDEQVADVLTYVRSNFSNKAPEIKAAEVGVVRKAK